MNLIIPSIGAIDKRFSRPYDFILNSPKSGKVSFLEQPGGCNFFYLKLMDDSKLYLTSEGFQKIKIELDELKNQKRPQTVERLSLARLQGDLSENNEYASAKEALAFIDERIEELEGVLKKVCLVDEKHGSCKCVGFGCKVAVHSDKSDTLYHIVGEWEADPSQKKISHSSPLGEALLGKKVGETVEFEAPAGKLLFKIVKID